jgi:hypothetical protein
VGGRLDDPESAELRRQRKPFYASLPAEKFPSVVVLRVPLPPGRVMC